MLTRGLGRSYGDASLPPSGRGPVACSVRADRVLAFDRATGILRAEAGLRLGDLADLFLSRGWFVPVTPGTRDVTLGGMVAADVHGKNHHVAGTLGAHVRSLRMRLPGGSIEDVRDDTDRELFRATLGGMGLTGHILDVTLALERVPCGHLVEEMRAFPDLESLIEGLEEAGKSWPFTVAWSDLLAGGGRRGRGILLCGRWATAEEASRGSRCELPRLRVPAAMPPVLGNASVGAFNAFRYEAARKACERDGGCRTSVRGASSFFYPLDALRDWNRLYGRRGFTQYQCVVPRDASARSYRALIDVACSTGAGPFLSVIKDCGAEGNGLLSFPMPGISFALDFPILPGSRPDGSGSPTAALVSRLNEVVAEAGGRIYLAKDAFTTAAQFARMEPRLGRFLALKKRIDPHGSIDSALAARLFPAA